jgi:hypothetical protein
MRRPVRWLLLLVVLLLVGGVAAVVLTSTPELDDTRDRVDVRWEPLREPLVARYFALAGIRQKLDDAGEADRAVTKDLDSALFRWQRLARRSANRSDVGAEATTANELEALGLRVKANVAGSPRLAGNEPLRDSLVAFDAAVVPTPEVEAYNRAVDRYQETRDEAFKSLVADVFGYGAYPVLRISGG